MLTGDAISIFSLSRKLTSSDEHSIYAKSNEVECQNALVEYVHSPDIVAIGCSFTSGTTIPPDLMWTHLVRGITGKTVNVVAKDGGSIEQLLYLFLQHLKNYGVPKTVMGFLPDFGRLELRVPGNLNQRKLSAIYWDHNKDHFVQPNPPNKPKKLSYRDFTGRKHFVSLSAAVCANLDALENLVDICEILGICTEISSWTRPEGWSLLNLPNYFPPQQFILDPKTTECDRHQPQSQRQKEWWTKSTDGHHHGHHHQIHIAETMLQRNISNSDLAGILG